MPDEAVFELEGEPLYSCPQMVVDAEAMEALDMWAWAERGFLPRAGGVADQDERDLQMIMIVAEMRRKAQREGD